MKEVELKFLNINLVALRRQLKNLGAQLLIKKQLVTDIFFTPATGSAARFSTFRLRKIGRTSYLTIKIKIKHNKFAVRDEFEIRVSDFNLTKIIILKAGFRVLYEREKYREEYRLPGGVVEIDEYPGAPPYLEVEVHEPKAFPAVLKLLGLKIQDGSTLSATEILKKYHQNKKVLRFK